MRRLISLLAATALALVLASGVALAVTRIGTDGPDTLRGTNGADQLVGKAGNDILLALAGNDTLLGGDGKDIVNGGSRQEPFGGAKNLVGGGGNDAVQGGLGSDNLGPRKATTSFWRRIRPARRERHRFRRRRQRRDRRLQQACGQGRGNCGGGIDRVFADRADAVAPDCEKVFVGEDNFDAYFESIPKDFFDNLNPQF